MTWGNDGSNVKSAATIRAGASTTTARPCVTTPAEVLKRGRDQPEWSSTIGSRIHDRWMADVE